MAPMLMHYERVRSPQATQGNLFQPVDLIRPLHCSPSLIRAPSWRLFCGGKCHAPASRRLAMDNLLICSADNLTSIPFRPPFHFSGRSLGLGRSR
jgi:hypothetical protein